MTGIERLRRRLAVVDARLDLLDPGDPRRIPLLDRRAALADTIESLTADTRERQRRDLDL